MWSMMSAIDLTTQIMRQDGVLIRQFNDEDDDETKVHEKTLDEARKHDEKEALGLE